ncbi:DUF2813 domain-containing protein [uncultured Methanobrevibacter sp.]|uniref:DUF2813 domain-containing protein n=1 Tax=uncultured Methanobrevibacter sp. TaxID=253161 RepID=UPI00262606EE|nr:AAA family ATPase [uncultured Methanobrevibacter sp.]
MERTKMRDVRALEVQHFRGISTKKTIDLSSKINILWGENGTGKSSFVNALEYLFKGKLAALDFSAKGNKKAFIHKGSDEDDFEIKLIFGDRAEYVKNITDPEPSKAIRKFLNKNKSFLNEASFILTRKKLLEFINGSPTDKYKSIMRLCGLAEIDDMRKEFNDTKLHYNRLLKDITKKLDISTQKLNNILGTNDLSSKDDFILKINEILKSNGYDLIDDKTDFDDYLVNLNFAELVNDKNNIHDFREVYSDIDVDGLACEFNQVLKEYEKIHVGSSKSIKIYYDLVKTSKEYLDLTSPLNCPVCNSEIDSSDLAVELESKLNDIEDDLSSLKIWQKQLLEFKQKLSDVISRLEKINSSLSKLSIEESIDVGFLADLGRDLDDLSEFKVSIIDLKDKYDFNELKNSLEYVKNLVDDKDSSLMDDENYREIKMLRSAINEFKLFCSLVAGQQLLSSKLKLSQTILDVYDKNKKEFVEKIITNIQDDITKFYKFIHGDDLINTPELVSKSANAVNLFLDSFGEKSDPRQFSSEGHLDTLGLCIFLAFVKEYNPLRLIVLDDIISTVDFSHKYEIAKLICEEFDNFNFLITTHNGLWVNQLKGLCGVYGHNCNEMHISNWSITEGPIFRISMKYSQLIEKYLNDDEFPAAVNTARQYLEFTTYEYCKKHTVSIKISERYELKPLFDACRAKSEESNDERLIELWDELDKNYFIVNQLSHFNIDSYIVHSGEVKRLCSIVLELCPKLK